MVDQSFLVENLGLLEICWWWFPVEWLFPAKGEELIVCNAMMYAMHGVIFASQNEWDCMVCTWVVNVMTYGCKCMELKIVCVVALLEAGKINPFWSADGWIPKYKFCCRREKSNIACRLREILLGKSEKLGNLLGNLWSGSWKFCSVRGIRMFDTNRLHTGDMLAIL